MKTKALVLALALLLTAYTLAFAQEEEPPQPGGVILSDEQGEYRLGPHLEILEDPSGELTIQEVTSPEFEGQFTPSQAVTPRFGFTRSVYWARFHLKNATRQTDEWRLAVGFPNMQFVDLYLPAPSGEGYLVKGSGALRPFETRDVAHRLIVFNVPLPPQDEQTIYLRFQSEASMTLGLTLRAPGAFLQHTRDEMLGLGLFYGVLLIMLAYHLFLLVSLREASYVYYVFFLASGILLFAEYDGLGRQYLWPGLVGRMQFTIATFQVLFFMSIVKFSDAFLDLKNKAPRWHRLVTVVLAVWGLFLLLQFFLSFSQLARLYGPWTLLSLAVVWAAGLVIWRQGHRRPALLFLSAWIGIIIGLMSVILVRQGYLPSTLLTEESWRVGMVWLVALWSLALADHINLLRAETEEANRELRASEDRLAQVLEAMPVGVVVYGTDNRPQLINQQTVELLSNPERGIGPDPTLGRTLAESAAYYSFRVAGSEQTYPLERLPVVRALQGEHAAADDIEVDLVDERRSLEAWASPIFDEGGNVHYAVAAFRDITKRKQADAELAQYRNHLELLVEKRTAELHAVEQLLRQRIEWLSAFKEVSQTTGGMEDLLYWGDGKQLEALCQLCGEETICDVKNLSASFQIDFPLREKIEGGDLITIAAGQAPSLPPPLSESFRDPDSKSLIVAPMIVRGSVLGLLGLAMPQPTQEITQAQTDLVETLSYDLASLTENAQLADQALTLVTVQERHRLARDLHDSVTQTLFTASVLAEATPRMWDKNQVIARTNLEKLSVLLRGALAEMRSLLLELRSGEPYEKSLDQLLSTLAEEVRAQSRAVVTVSMMYEPELPDNVSLAFYRIAREALNNVVKHAAATQINVSILEEPDRVELRIQDDGIGFDPRAVPSEHLGISIMAERAAQIGGDLRIQSEPGHGTEIVLAWSGDGGEHE
jgi:signal transduction histidine kinase